MSKGIYPGISFEILFLADTKWCCNDLRIYYFYKWGWKIFDKNITLLFKASCFKNVWFFSVIDEAQILNFMNYFESKSFKAFSLYGLKEASGDEKRNSFFKRIRISNSQTILCKVHLSYSFTTKSESRPRSFWQGWSPFCRVVNNTALRRRYGRRRWRQCLPPN